MPRLIAHLISKEQHQAQTRTNLRDELLPANEFSQAFIDQLRSAITLKNPVAAKFTRAAGAQPAFEQRLRRYQAGISDEAYIALTRDATQLLATEMSAEPLTTGGYLVFAEQTHAGDDYLVIVLLSTRAQPTFDEDLNLVSSTTLDLEHLRHAGRIRLPAVAANEDGVVHVVSHRAGNVSDYFRKFLGCEDVTDSAAQGGLLYSAIRGFADTAIVPTEQEELMQRTYSYWQDCRRMGNPMTLTGLANVLHPADPELVLGYLGRENLGLAGEFTAPPHSVMKRFVKFAFNRSGLKIEFDRNGWLGHMTVRGQSLTIRHAPQDLLNQINEEKGE